MINGYVTCLNSVHPTRQCSSSYNCSTSGWSVKICSLKQETIIPIISAKSINLRSINLAQYNYHVLASVRLQFVLIIDDTYNRIVNKQHLYSFCSLSKYEPSTVMAEYETNVKFSHIWYLDLADENLLRFNPFDLIISTNHYRSLMLDNLREGAANKLIYRSRNNVKDRLRPCCILTHLYFLCHTKPSISDTTIRFEIFDSQVYY